MGINGRRSWSWPTLDRNRCSGRRSWMYQSTKQESPSHPIRVTWTQVPPCRYNSKTPHAPLPHRTGAIVKASFASFPRARRLARPLSELSTRHLQLRTRRLPADGTSPVRRGAALVPASGRAEQWRDQRTVINGIVEKLRTGAPWRDLPERYGQWQTYADRLYRWRRATRSASSIIGRWRSSPPSPSGLDPDSSDRA